MVIIINTRVDGSLSLSLSLTCQHFVQQGFVDEMVTTGKVLWLKDFSSSEDKIGDLAKVLKLLCYSNRPRLFVFDFAYRCFCRLFSGNLSKKGGLTRRY